MLRNLSTKEINMNDILKAVAALIFIIVYDVFIIYLCVAGII